MKEIIDALAEKYNLKEPLEVTKFVKDAEDLIIEKYRTTNMRSNEKVEALSYVRRIADEAMNRPLFASMFSDVILTYEHEIINDKAGNRHAHKNAMGRFSLASIRGAREIALRFLEHTEPDNLLDQVLNNTINDIIEEKSSGVSLGTCLENAERKLRQLMHQGLMDTVKFKEMMDVIERSVSREKGELEESSRF